MRFDIFDAKEVLAKYEELGSYSVDEIKGNLEFRERLLFGSANTHTMGFLFVDEESQLVQSRAWEGHEEAKRQAVTLVTVHHLIVMDNPDDPRYCGKNLNDFTITEQGREFLALKAIFEAVIPEPPPQ
jgi:hypothetical protein